MFNLKRFSIKTSYYGYVFLLPYLIILFIFQLYPVIYTFILSFSNLSADNPQIEFIGFANYIKLFGDKFFLRSVINTWRIWVVNFIPQMSLALGMAAILTGDKIRGKSLFRGIYFVPELITAASVGVLFNVLLGWKNGTINNLLVALRIISEEDKIHFLADPVLISTSVSMILVWMWFGYGMIFFMAAMKAVPKNLYEAAAIDGADAWNSFWKITIPQIRSTIIYVFVVTLIGALSNFDIPFVMGEDVRVGTGGPQNSILTIVMYIYRLAFAGARQKGYAATVAIILFIMILIFSLLIFKVMSRGRDSEDIKGV